MHHDRRALLRTRQGESDREAPAPCVPSLPGTCVAACACSMDPVQDSSGLKTRIFWAAHAAA